MYNLHSMLARFHALPELLLIGVCCMEQMDQNKTKKKYIYKLESTRTYNWVEIFFFLIYKQVLYLAKQSHFSLTSLRDEPSRCHAHPCTSTGRWAVVAEATVNAGSDTDGAALIRLYEKKGKKSVEADADHLLPAFALGHFSFSGELSIVMNENYVFCPHYRSFTFGFDQFTLSDSNQIDLS